MWYGSLVRRQGRSRPWARYHVRSRRRNRCRASGSGREEEADINPYNFTRDPSTVLRVTSNGSPGVKIYTKAGDAGETSLFDQTRVSKSDPRVDAYGEVDE